MLSRLLTVAWLFLLLSCQATEPATPAPLHPDLSHFWQGEADFAVEVSVTGLPMGESETIVMPNGEWWSYVHASDRSASVRDQCGDPVPFPGCVVRYISHDQGQTFTLEDPTCLMACNQCPCDSETDHINQQQYPDIYIDGQTWHMVYEYAGRTMWRTSHDGLQWSQPQRIGHTGHWKRWLFACPPAEAIGSHPFVPDDFECLAGGPPGIYGDEAHLYVFVGVGQNPGGMGCFRAPKGVSGAGFMPCQHNPLFRGANTYGPVELTGIEAHPYFDFRTISSAEIVQLADSYYLLYEGIRGPSAPTDPGDSQFGLGLAKSVEGGLDGRWQRYPQNPILVDLPANIGLGHADIVQHNGQTILYTSLDGVTRSRLVLQWMPESNN